MSTVKNSLPFLHISALAGNIMGLIVGAYCLSLFWFSPESFRGIDVYFGQALASVLPLICWGAFLSWGASLYHLSKGEQWPVFVGNVTLGLILFGFVVTLITGSSSFSHL